MTKEDKIKSLNDGEWKMDHRDDGISFLAYPAYWSKSGCVWFGGFDPWVAEYILDAVKEKQERERKP